MGRIGNLVASSATALTVLGVCCPTALAQAPARATQTAVPSAPSAPVECVPACRAGFLCVQGQCISACNPPCAANETCNNGQCVASAQPGVAPAVAPAVAPSPYAAAQPAPGAAPGAAMQPAGATMNLATPAPAPAPAEEAKIKTFSFVPRIGLQLGGSGTAEDKCDGSDCTGYTNTSTDYDLKTAFSIGADFMFKLGDLFRIGPGFLYTTTMDVKASGATSNTELGSIVDVNFVAEVIPRVSPTVWLVPRVQLGLSVLNASGDMKTALDNGKTTCLNNAYTGCDSFDNPHVGFNLGLGFGAMFAVAPTIRLRVDTMYEYYSISVYSYSAPGLDANVTGSASGGRYFLLAGMEI